MAERGAALLSHFQAFDRSQAQLKEDSDALYKRVHPWVQLDQFAPGALLSYH